ncbi:hypothetical protein RJ640_018760 [Escallonia rubra]|uniref:DUF7880 domain-containing protein n=1 Tax=Escallonia rubra TaxID=112253 RepID=A0AA88RNT8_9ASTE|nr:hypothetical protein RJ640_018760 [Escallonia rubra]
MATSTAIAAHLSSTGRFTSTSIALQAPNSASKVKQQNFTVQCALFPHQRQETRRSISISLLLLHLLSVPKYAIAGGMDKYVKRKKLDPLEAYVPAIILTEVQIKELGKTLEVDQPQYAACRNLLRAGPAASLRINIRAVAQYASEGGNEKTAFNDVDQCLGALEELDSLLLRASRNAPEASVKSMKSKIGIAIDALDSLLQTVPSEILDKGKAIADAYLTPEDVEPGNLDPELKQLESIL